MNDARKMVTMEANRNDMRDALEVTVESTFTNDAASTSTWVTVIKPASWSEERNEAAAVDDVVTEVILFATVVKAEPPEVRMTLKFTLTPSATASKFLPVFAEAEPMAVTDETIIWFSATERNEAMPSMKYISSTVPHSLRVIPASETEAETAATCLGVGAT